MYEYTVAESFQNKESQFRIFSQYSFWNIFQRL